MSWQVIVGLLGADRLDVPAVATATARAADRRLAALESDEAVAYCFWLLARLASASRRDFADALRPVGLDARPTDSVIGFVAQVGDQVRDEVELHPESGPFGELASLALRRALTETVGTEGRSFFGGSVADLERAFLRHSTPARFGMLAHRFFGDFLARTLRFYVDKELPLRVGAGGGLIDIDRSESFVADLDHHARQSARIVERFAADWFSKHDREAQGAIGREDAQAFVAVALGKLRGELAAAARPPQA
jgi:hypothetical protein